MSSQAPVPVRSPAPAAPDPLATDPPVRPGARLALLGLVVAAEVAWLATRSVLQGPGRWVPALGVVVLHLGLVLAEHRRPVLGARTVLGATALVGLAAVVVPPFGSRDSYLYAEYGRMVTWHHVNPYLSAPEAVAGDPLLPHVAHAWRSVPTAYGPVFTAWSALGALAFGDSPLRARLFFQATAAGALLTATWYLHRRGRPPAVLVAVGLAPVLVATVNGGHLDLLAGVLALVGVDLVVRRRAVPGAVVVGLACAVKLLLLPVAAVVVLAPAVERRWGEAGRRAATIGGVLVAGYLAVGGPQALAPLGSINQAVARGTLWGTLSRDDGLNVLLRRDGWAHPLSLALVAGLLVLLVWRAARPVDVVVLATAAGVVVCFGSEYSLPWYAAGFLLVGALSRSLPAIALAAGSTVQLLVYVQPPGALMGELPGAIDAAFLGGAALAGLLVVTVVWVVRDGRRGRSAPAAGAGRPGDPAPTREPVPLSRGGS